MTTIQTKLGLSEKERIKVEMAISQMRDRGYLTMEDFIYQLGNVLPGVSIILANLLRLNIKNTHNLIKKGYISSNILDNFLTEYNNSL